MSARRPAALVATVLAALAGVALAGTACGVPVSSSPQAVHGVPAGLLLPAAATHVRPPRNSNGVFDIYLVGGDQLVEVARAGSPTPQSLLAALDTGPSTFESNVEGITSDVPLGAHVTVVKLHGHVATVNLDASFGEISLLGVAQIVYTVTQLKGISEVAFYQAGSPVNAPNERGNYLSRPLTRADFGRFGPSLPVTSNPPAQHKPGKPCSLAVGNTCS